MTVVEGLWAAGLVFGFLVAGAHELGMTGWVTPRRVLRSWVMWGGFAAATWSLMSGDTQSVGKTLLQGIAAAVVGPPLMAAFMFLIIRAARYDVWSMLARYSGSLGPAPKSFLTTQAIVTAVLLVAGPLLTVTTDRARDPLYRLQIVSALHQLRFEPLRIQRIANGAKCWDGISYAWSADAGEGRACLRDMDQVTVWTDKNRTSKDPFARPAR